MWSEQGSKWRLDHWKKLWKKRDSMHNHDDWYGSDADFVKAVSSWLPPNTRILELGAGKSGVAAELALNDRVASILSTDISPDIVDGLKVRHNARQLPKLAFATLDSLNVQLNGTDYFNIVIEKAGLFDVHQQNTVLLERTLACITTKAFNPRSGGYIVVLAKGEGAKFGVSNAVKSRPDFNCSIAETIPVTPPTQKTDRVKNFCRELWRCVLGNGSEGM
jgi:hypothetical protein